MCVSHLRITQSTVSSPPNQVELFYYIIRIRELCHFTVDIVNTVRPMSRKAPLFSRAHSYRRGHLLPDRYILHGFKIPQGTRPVTGKHIVVCNCPVDIDHTLEHLDTVGYFTVGYQDIAGFSGRV